MLAHRGCRRDVLVQPPADLWPLAWLAPVPWLAIVAAPMLTARRPWWPLWAGGFAHWLLAIHWLRLPHPATSIGWVALSAYLACYLPLFIWIARRLVHRHGWPLVAAAPCGMGSPASIFAARCSAASRSPACGTHRWRWTTLIQSADIAAAPSASAASLTLVAAAVVRRAAVRPAHHRRPAPWRRPSAYGAWRMAGVPAAVEPALDVLLVQGSIDTELKHDPDAATDVAAHYDALTMAGLAAEPRQPDLVVWPETMWRWGLVEIDPTEDTGGERGRTDAVGTLQMRLSISPPIASGRCRRGDRAGAARRRWRCTPRRYATRWLVGVDKQVIDAHRGRRRCATSTGGLFLDATGMPLACYDKIHPGDVR